MTDAAAAATADTANADTSKDPGAGADPNAGKTAANDGGEGDHGIDTSDSLLNDAAELEAVDFSKGMPKNFPKEAWDEEKKAPKADVLYNKLQEAENRAKGLRDKLAKGEGKPPKDPKEYKFQPSEKAKAVFKDGDASKDPLVQAALPIAHKYKMTQEQLQGFMSEMSDYLADAVDKAKDEGPAELSEEQKKEIRAAEHKKIGTNAPQVIKAVETWGRQLKQEGIFSEADVAAFKSMAFSGENVRVLNKLRSLAGGGNIPMEFGDDGLPSDAEIAEMQAAVKSQADQDKVDALYEKRRAAGRPDKLQF